MKAKQANKLSRRRLDKLFICPIKKAANNGYFSYTDTMYCLSNSALECIIAHYTRLGYKVDVTDKSNDFFSFNCRITVSWGDIPPHINKVSKLAAKHPI